MGKIYYYYDPIVISGCLKYCVKYYCTNGKKKVLAGYTQGDTQIEALRNAKNIVHILNAPRPIFGQCSLMSKWLWWIKAVNVKTVKNKVKNK